MPLFPVDIQESREARIYVEAADHEEARVLAFELAGDVLEDAGGMTDIYVGKVKTVDDLGIHDEVFTDNDGSYTAAEYRNLLARRRKVEEHRPLQKEQLPLGLDESVPV